MLGFIIIISSSSSNSSGSSSSSSSSGSRISISLPARLARSGPVHYE